ncbi:two-component system response regulator YesN [Lachnospiraceae bacterium PF1-21]|uniref:Stage 0 sporulation protein A homolog n=1 Tax=Ohessyouella blattaphilus TaxID=2949333 RepID=A0ABT1EER6_9FIRM|nr:response regulator [Ohessyouella blattaphilus]MCP1108996.1 response regulator [Ohessyouella blattaphilus]MCR8562390.1 response regulator [Ohessyouella blattaphilus]
MTKILICDDEGIVRESLQFIIQKNFKDEFVTEVAKNGRIAIELAESFRPDIIMMDIQMPGINGIEAMAEIRLENKNVLFIVLTAYDKFEYSQASIDVGVFSYLTKPINKDVLCEVLRKAAQKVKTKKQKVKSDLLIKEKMEAVIPLVESGLVYSILLDNTNDSGDGIGYRELLDIKEDYGYVLLLTAGDELRKGKLTNLVGAGIALGNQFQKVRETLKEALPGIVGEVMSNKIVMIIPCLEEREDYQTRIQKIEGVRALLRKLEQQTNLKFKAGIGSVVPWSQMLESYREASSTVSGGIGKVTHAKDMPVSCVYEEDYPIDLEKKLFDGIERGNAEETKKYSEEFIYWMQSRSTGLDNSVRLKVIEFILWAERLVYMQGGIVYRFNAREDYMDTLLGLVSFEEVEVWFVRKMTEAAEHIAMSRQERTGNVVERAKTYINDHFTGDLSLETLAGEIGISPYYLSKLFKEIEKVNYIDYVTGLRMDYAKAALSGSEKSIKEICAESGYSDPNYFSRIFKRWTGKTPTEYREGI